MARSIAGEMWPKSVTRTTASGPASSRKPTGSRASWGMAKGTTVNAPTGPGSPARSRPRSGGRASPFGEAPFRADRSRHSQVPSVANSGRSWRAANRNAPREWSPCSWETSTASSDFGSHPARASRRSSSRQENPASTSSEEPPPVTSAALPELPEPRARRWMAGGNGIGRNGTGGAPRAPLSNGRPPGGTDAAPAARSRRE